MGKNKTQNKVTDLPDFSSKKFLFLKIDKRREHLEVILIRQKKDCSRYSKGFMDSSSTLSTLKL